MVVFGFVSFAGTARNSFQGHATRVNVVGSRREREHLQSGLRMGRQEWLGWVWGIQCTSYVYISFPPPLLISSSSSRPPPAPR